MSAILYQDQVVVKVLARRKVVVIRIFERRRGNVEMASGVYMCFADCRSPTKRVYVIRTKEVITNQAGEGSAYSAERTVCKPPFR